MRFVSVMIKPASSNCNLKCSYCFYSSVASDRECYSYGMMTADTAHKIVDKAIAYSDGGSVSFVFQGGEPLLAGYDFYSDFFAYAVSLSGRLSFSVQTNGLLLDEKFAELFFKYKVLVGLSLDGDATNNIYRSDVNGNSSFKQVMTAAAIMKKHKVEFNILAVVTKRSAKNITAIYNFFKSKGFRYLQFIPCLKPLNDTGYDKDMYMSETDYYNFLTELFSLYYNDIMNNNYISIRSFDNYVLLCGGRNAEQCSMNGRCSEQYVVEANGNVYPCDFYCNNEYLLGNINDSDFYMLASGNAAKKFLSTGSVITGSCIGCRYVRVCRGNGCRRYKADGDMCGVYKRFFSENEIKFIMIANKFF